MSDWKALSDKANAIKTREDLAAFILELLRDFEANKSEWENTTLDRYLDALGACIDALDGYYHNLYGTDVPEQPTWSMIGRLLWRARVYE